MNLLDKKNNLTFRDYLRIFKRRLGWFLIPFVGVIGGGVFFILNEKPTYKSTTLIRVSENNELSIGLKKLMPTSRGKGTDIKQIAKEIVSSKYLSQLIDSLDLQPEEKVVEQARELNREFPDKPFEEILQELRVDKLKNKIYARSLGTNLIEVGVTSPSPEISYLAAKTLVDIFIQDAMENELKAINNALKFSSDQIAYYEQKLTNAEARLEEFERTLSLTEVENKSLDQMAVDRIKEALATVDIRIEEVEKEVERINRRFPDELNPQTPPETPYMASLKRTIYTKIDRTALLLEEFSWTTPQVIKLNREIDELRDQWEEEVTRSYRVILSGEDLAALDLHVTRAMTLFDLELWNKRRDALNQLMEEHKRYIAQEPINEQDLTKLEEEVEQLKTIYNSLVEQSQGTQLKEAMQKADLLSRYQVLEPARKPVVPLSSGSTMKTALTGMLAIFAGFGTLFAIEYFDGSVRTVEEAEKEFDIPVIAVIPNLEETEKKNHRPKVPVTS